MKAMRYLTFAAAVATGASCSGQAVDFVFISKLVDYQQTDTSAVSLVTNPYLFTASISGTGLSSTFPAPPNTVTVPSGTVTSVTLNAPDAFSNEWGFESSGYASIAALDGAYGSGTYTVTFGGTPQNLSLSNGTLYPNAPIATISTNTGLGLAWSGGTLIVDPSLFATFSIATSGAGAFTTNRNNASNHIGIFGQGFTTEPQGEVFNSTTGVFNLDIAAASFLGGVGSKSIEIEFNNIIDFLENTPSAGITSVSAFTSVTTIQLQVIPEPSTYAAVLGALALAGVMIHRRRRAIS